MHRRRQIHHSGAKIEVYGCVHPSKRRQSVTIPGDLVRDLQRSAKHRHETVSATLIHYARAGIAEEQKAKQKLRDLVKKIQAAPTPQEAEQKYGDELIETIFGPQSYSLCVPSRSRRNSAIAS